MKLYLIVNRDTREPVGSRSYNAKRVYYDVKGAKAARTSLGQYRMTDELRDHLFQTVGIMEIDTVAGTIEIIDEGLDKTESV